MPRRLGVSAAIDWLCDRYGFEKARRIVRLEQRKARQARSRSRFSFWAMAAEQMDAKFSPQGAPAPETQPDIRAPWLSDATRASLRPGLSSALREGATLDRTREG